MSEFVCDHVWDWESDRELCVICGEERPAQKTIHDLLARQQRLERADIRVTAAAEALCNCMQPTWSVEAQDAARRLLDLVWSESEGWR